MAEPLVVVGAGGFGREALDVALAMNEVSEAPLWDIRGVVDDAPSELNLRRLVDRGVPWLGEVKTLERDDDAWVAIGIGAPQIRRAVSGRLALPACRHATLVHPTVVHGSCSSIGSGSILCAGVVLGTNVTLGQLTHLNARAVIGHDSTTGDFVSINPSATVSGECRIAEAALVGAGAVVLQGRSVGCESVVGAAACVVHDVPEGRSVKGVPAV